MTSFLQAITLLVDCATKDSWQDTLLLSILMVEQLPANVFFNVYLIDSFITELFPTMVRAGNLPTQFRLGFWKEITELENGSKGPDYLAKICKLFFQVYTTQDNKETAITFLKSVKPTSSGTNLWEAVYRSSPPRPKEYLFL